MSDESNHLRISDLRTKLQFHEAEARKYRTAIEGLQQVCEHNWVYTGHGHNFSCYACTICGLEEER